MTAKKELSADYADHLEERADKENCPQITAEKAWAGAVICCLPPFVFRFLLSQDRWYKATQCES